MAEEQKFPSEIVDLPSGGKVYGENSPLKDGTIEIKYMTAKEEDILTSQNLIRKGIVLEKLLDSLILTKGVVSDDLLTGDRNAVLVSARVLAYGPEYECNITNPNTDETMEHSFDLTSCEYKILPDDVDYSNNKFKFKLPGSGINITFKLLTGKDEKAVDAELKSMSKIGATREMTTRLRYIITSVDGKDDKATINSFVDNMLSRDSLALRKEVQRIQPDIDLTQEVDFEGDAVKVDIPMTANFFWPSDQL